MELADKHVRFETHYNSVWISFWLSMLSIVFSLLAMSLSDKIALDALIIGILAFILASAVATAQLIQFFHRSHLIVTTSGGRNLQGLAELRLNVVSGESRIELKEIYVENERKKKLKFMCDAVDGMRRTMLLQPHESTSFAVQYLELGQSKSIRFCVRYGKFRTSKTEWRTVDHPLKGLTGIS